MITGPLSKFEARCRERGCTLEQVRGCIVIQDGDTITVDELHKDYPRPKQSQKPSLERTDAPSFLEKVKNFAVSSAKHVAAGMPMASDAEILRRHDICRGCEFFKDNACQKCGCPIVRTKQYISKLSWADQECPVGKWGKEKPQQDIDK